MIVTRIGKPIIKHSLQVSCEEYGFHVAFEDSNIESWQSDYIHLKFTSEELDLLIETLERLKKIKEFNLRAEQNERY